MKTAPTIDLDARQLVQLQAAQLVYDREYARCPRSPEWKAGALRGLRLAAGLKPADSPYKLGTAQDDAWIAGNREGMSEWRWRDHRGKLPGQSGWERDELEVPL